MKHNKYTAWVEIPVKNKWGRVGRLKLIMLGSYYAFTMVEARIHARSDAIKRGFDYKLVKIVKDD